MWTRAGRCRRRANSDVAVTYRISGTGLGTGSAHQWRLVRDGETDRDLASAANGDGTRTVTIDGEHIPGAEFRLALDYTPGTGASGTPTAEVTRVVIRDANNAKTLTPTTTNSAPTFDDGETTTRSVAENTAAGQNIGAPVAATDGESDPLTYSLGGTNAASFDIVATTGQLRTSAALNFETKDSYTVTVSVSDSKDADGNTDTATDDSITVTINVGDVNEAPSAPDAPTVTATANSATSLDVSWSAPSNTGRPAIASYDLRYRAGTGGSFTNGPQDVSGTSATIGSLAPNTAYQVQVRATNAEGDSSWSDSGSGTTGNRAPVFGATSYSFDLAENADGSSTAIALGTVAASDADNDAVSYSITAGNTGNRFVVGSSSGAITYSGTGENFEGLANPASAYTLTVQASDGSAAVTVPVTVRVTDVNEAPTLPNNWLTAQTATVGTAFSYQFGEVTDPDSGDTVSYSADVRTGGAGTGSDPYTYGSLPSWLTFNTGTRTFSCDAAGTGACQAGDLDHPGHRQRRRVHARHSLGRVHADHRRGHSRDDRLRHGRRRPDRGGLFGQAGRYPL